MTHDWLKQEARERKARHEVQQADAQKALEACKVFAEHYYKLFDSLVDEVGAALNAYNAELPVPPINFKREGYSFRAELGSNWSFGMSFDGYTDQYPKAGGCIVYSCWGRGESGEFRKVENTFCLSLEREGMVMKDKDVAIPRGAWAQRFLRPFFELLP